MALRDWLRPKAVVATMKAGWIAERCSMCHIDNELEEIFPCTVHKDEIARLSAISMGTKKEDQ